MFFCEFFLFFFSLNNLYPCGRIDTRGQEGLANICIWQTYGKLYTTLGCCVPMYVGQGGVSSETNQNNLLS